MPFPLTRLFHCLCVAGMALFLLDAGAEGSAAAGSAISPTPAGTAASAPAPALLTVSSDGTEIIDQRGRLAWMRCAEGMQWNGSGCTGRPLLMDRSQAHARAQERSKTDRLLWRLPRVNELRRLVNKNATPPGLDAQLFPSAPLDWHWSGTARIRHQSVNPYNYDNVAQGRTSPGTSGLDVAGGWAVNLATGAAQGETARHSKLRVRLVRTLDSQGR